MNKLAQQYVDFVSGILSHISKWKSQRRLKRLGIYLDFGQIPKGWVQAIHPADLSSTWHKMGLPIEGVGYSTIGAIKNGQISTRFIPDSNYYQAWLGGYLIHPQTTFGIDKDGEPVFSQFAQVAVADQIYWLRNYGCTQPQVTVIPDSIRLIHKLQHQDYRAWWIEAEILSNSDIGDRNRYPNGYFLYAIYEKMFERFGNIKLPLHSTLPPRTSLPPYHSLNLKGNFEIVSIPEYQIWIILYGCGADWNGEDRFLQLKDEIISTIQKVKIKPFL